MPECQLVYQSERRTTKDRNLAAGLQRKTSAQFVKLLDAGRVCTDSSGDEGMSKASTELLEQGTQTPSPAPDLIPAQTENQPRTHIGIGTANGGTSVPFLKLSDRKSVVQRRSFKVRLRARSLNRLLFVIRQA